MPNTNVAFNGQTLVIPGAYYGDNVVAAATPTVPTTPPLIFLGYGYGQKPKTPVTYVTPQNLLSAIRGGPCSGFVQFLTNPSPQLNGAQQITYINVGSATQSSLTLQNSNASGVITLTSTNYGIPSNLLQAAVAAGGVSGSIQLTLYDGYANTQAIGNNLGIPFEVAYTGAATGVTYGVTVSGGVATTFFTSGAASGQNVSIPLGAGSYATVGSVVEYLNGTGFYSAIVLNNGSLPSTYLDSASGVALAVPSSGVNQYANVYAEYGDVIFWVNQYASSYATAVITSGTTSTSGAPLNVLPLTPFSGATSTPPTTSDYASGFNVALTVPGWAVFASSNASGVIALGCQHVATASQSVNGMWRRFFSGSSTGDSVATTQAVAQSMDQINATYVYPGVYANNTGTGQNQLYDGLHAAAAVAGMATGNAVATPLTNKQLNATGVEVLLTPSQINTLQQSGVMPIWIPQQTGVPTIVSDLTTWQVDSNPENVFNQQVACRYYLAYSVVNTLQPFVGSVANPLIETNILNAVKQVLNALLYNSGNANGVLVSWNASTLQLIYTGSNQLAAVQVSVVFVGQNRFVTAYVNVLPLSITVTIT